MSGDEREAFLTRWSRRKAGLAPTVDAPAVAQAPPAAPVAATIPAKVAATADPQPGAAAPVASAASPPAAEAAPPLPTLADVAALTRDSDYARFMQPGVDGAARNAAMKKLFSDPHFNVMDGLDTYIDDYGKPDPLPLAMLRRMNQSKALGLFQDDAETPPTANEPLPAAKACPDGAPAAEVAPSTPDLVPPSAKASPPADEDPDLRLQPDDADRRPSAGEGPRP